MFCVKCGTKLPDDANFCLKCGVPQQQGNAFIEEKVPWEICTVELADIKHRNFGKSEYQFVAEATGPSGIYVAARSDVFRGDPGTILWDERSEPEAQRALAQILGEAMADGWEPWQSPRSGSNDWFKHQLRRRKSK